MNKLQTALQKIVNNLSGIQYSELTTAEKYSLRTAIEALGWKYSVVNDDIQVEKS